MTAGHFIAGLQLALHCDEHFDHFQYARHQIIAGLHFLNLLFEALVEGVDGMVELDGQMCRVANSTTNTFELEGIDTSSYTALVASSTTFKKITAFSTLSNATNLTMPDGQPAKLDATRLISKRKEYLFGLPDAPDGSITTLYDPQVTAVSKIKAATLANTTLGIRVTWSNGYKTIFNAYVSGGQGFEASQNAVVTANISFTPVGQLIEFTS